MSANKLKNCSLLSSLMNDRKSFELCRNMRTLEIVVDSQQSQSQSLLQEFKSVEKILEILPNIKTVEIKYDSSCDMNWYVPEHFRSILSLCGELLNEIESLRLSVELELCEIQTLDEINSEVCVAAIRRSTFVYMSCNTNCKEGQTYLDPPHYLSEFIKHFELSKFDIFHICNKKCALPWQKTTIVPKFGTPTRGMNNIQYSQLPLVFIKTFSTTLSTK